MEKQTVLLPYHGILLSSEKEWTADTDHTDGLRGIMPSERSYTQKKKGMEIF